jgi:hypothetical protein
MAGFIKVGQVGIGIQCPLGPCDRGDASAALVSQVQCQLATSSQLPLVRQLGFLAYLVPLAQV